MAKQEVQPAKTPPGAAVARGFIGSRLFRSCRLYHANAAKNRSGAGHLEGNRRDNREVGRLTQLLQLELCGSSVTDAGLVHLEGMTKLCYLDLRRTQVTDAGLVHLKGMTKLCYLDLSHTQVTDAGLVPLSGSDQPLGPCTPRHTNHRMPKFESSSRLCPIERSFAHSMPNQIGL